MTKKPSFLPTSLTPNSPAKPSAAAQSIENENRWRMVADAVSLFRAQHPTLQAGSIEAEWLRAETAIDAMLMVTKETALPGSLALSDSSLVKAKDISKPIYN